MKYLTPHQAIHKLDDVDKEIVVCAIFGVLCKVSLGNCMGCHISSTTTFKGAYVVRCLYHSGDHDKIIAKFQTLTYEERYKINERLNQYGFHLYVGPEVL